VDTYSMNSNWTDFDNQAFLHNPTIPLPSQGLGAAALVLATDNIYVWGDLRTQTATRPIPGKA
ncbi:MAG: porin, partial [Deltaproteobacteria bacterium]|nr:porin [Deltaproteobacteria bacterium]